MAFYKAVLKHSGYLIVLLLAVVIAYRAGKHKIRTVLKHTEVIKRDTFYIQKTDTVIKWQSKIKYKYLKPDTIFIYDTIPVSRDTILYNKGILNVQIMHGRASFSGFVRRGGIIIPFMYKRAVFEGFMCNSYEILPTNSLNPEKAFILRRKRHFLDWRIIGGVEYPVNAFLSLHFYAGRLGLYGSFNSNKTWQAGIEYLITQGCIR